MLDPYLLMSMLFIKQSYAILTVSHWLLEGCSVAVSMFWRLLNLAMLR